MGITLFKHLDADQRIKVFKANAKLRGKVYDRMHQSVNDWCEEILWCWRDIGGIDYSLGFDYGTYFRATDNNKFLDGLEEAQSKYGLLSDEFNPVIERVRKLTARLLYVDINYPDDVVNYMRLEKRIDQLVLELTNACYKVFINAYESVYFDEENATSFYLECFVEELDGDKFYIDENYTLFEHVEYEKSYA